MPDLPGCAVAPGVTARPRRVASVSASASVTARTSGGGRPAQPVAPTASAATSQSPGRPIRSGPEPRIAEHHVEHRLVRAARDIETQVQAVLAGDEVAETGAGGRHVLLRV